MVTRKFCKVNNDLIPECPGLCCQNCPKAKKCSFTCSRTYLECDYRITVLEYKWRKILGSLVPGVL